MRRAPILLVYLAFGVLALAFGAAILVSQSTSGRIRTLVDDITENANPSVLHLVRERNVLWNLELQTQRARERLANGLSTPIDIASGLAAQDYEWENYDATPEFPGEQNIRNRVLPRVDHLKTMLRSLASASSAGDTRTVRRLLNEVPGAFQSASDGLMELIVLNQQLGHVAAINVEATRRMSSALAWGFGTIALLLTITLALIVGRSMRAVSRLQAERAATLQQRSVEHEMFAARVAHDIRAPLAVSQLWIDRCRTDSTDESRTRALEKIGVSIRRATQIVEDLYAFARANVSGNDRGQTPLKEAVKYAVDEVAPRAANAGIDLTTDVIPDIKVAAAPGIVASVLSNLLSNAVNYAGRGARITVKALVGERVRVNIADTGSGIPADVQARIFEPYVRGKSSSGTEGLGLGLATVKALVERCGGACGVESTPGLGSLFWFELPRFNNSPPAPA